MTVFEIFRVLLASEFAPQDKTIEFHWYAAEEAGLLGSQSVAAFYRENAFPVHSVFHIDMDGYIAAGTTPVIALATDYTNEQQAEFMRKLIDAYCNIPWKNTQCGYPCSDHASWTRAGFSASFTMEGEFKDSNPNIHTDRDTMEKLSFDHMKEYVKLGIAFAYNMATQADQ